MNKLLYALFSCIVLPCVPGPAVLAQAFADGHGGLLYHDNLTRSEHARDAREDSAFVAAGTAGVHLQPGTYTGLTLIGTLERTQYRRYAGLSSWQAGLGASLSHKFGLGEMQPTLVFDLGVARAEYNADLRDAWIYRAGLSLRKRVTGTLNLRAGVDVERQDGDHDLPRTTLAVPRPGSPWDLDNRGLFLGAEQDLGPATWLDAMYRFQDGEVVSTAVPYAKILNAATAITLDPLFGPLTVAYRIPARTHIVAVDLNRAVFEAGTLYIGLEYQQTHGRSGIDYESGLLRGGFIHSF